MIKVDYVKLKVSGDWNASFSSKEEMEKKVRAYVFMQGRGLDKGSRPFIFKKENPRPDCWRTHDSY